MTHVLDAVLAGRRDAIVYPAARMGRRAARMLTERGVNVIALGDRQMTGEVDGYPVLSAQDVAQTGAAVLVASTTFDSEITRDLTDLGCDVVPIGYLNMRLPDVFQSREYDGSWAAVRDPRNASAIESVCRSLADDASRAVLAGKVAYYRTLDKRHIDDIRSDSDIYFDIRSLRADESFVDGGAYVGDTLTRFLDLADGTFESYVAFEPDPVTFATLETVTADWRVSVVQAALSDKASPARLLSTHGLDARLLADDEPGGDTVPTVRLDDHLSEPPTFLKLDVEGWEKQALLGAASLLSRGRTTVAASVYHYPTDLWTIPLMLKRLVPDSRLFLRHYSHEVHDTVVYAVPA